MKLECPDRAHYLAVEINAARAHTHKNTAWQRDRRWATQYLLCSL